MDDLAAKIGELLNNPEAMERIKNMASMFGAAGGPSGEKASAPPAAPAPPSDAVPAVPDVPAVPNPPAVPGMDADMLKTMMKIAPMLSRFRQEDDSTRLLRALRPFLSPEKRKKLDEAIRLMQFVRMIPLIKSSGIF